MLLFLHPPGIFSQNRLGRTAPFLQTVARESGFHRPGKFVDSPLQVPDGLESVLDKKITGQERADAGMTIDNHETVFGNSVEILGKTGHRNMDSRGKPDKPVFPFLPDIEEQTSRFRDRLSGPTGKERSHFLAGYPEIIPTQERLELPNSLPLGLIRVRRAASGGRQFPRSPSMPGPAGDPCPYEKRTGALPFPAPPQARPAQS